MGSLQEQSWVRRGPIGPVGPVRTIRLEPLTLAHAPDLLRIADRDLFTHTRQAPTSWSVRGFEEELGSVLELADVVAYAIVPLSGPEAGRAIGRTTFMDIKAEHRGLEIGRTWIGRAYHGTRVNPEAKYLMLRHAFEVLSPTAIRVQITTNGTNVHSQRAISKLGAVKEGVLRKARVMPPALDRAETLVRDWVIYSVLEEEWGGVKAGLEERLGAMA